MEGDAGVTDVPFSASVDLVLRQARHEVLETYLLILSLSKDEVHVRMTIEKQTRILFVCTGNICHSPTAEGVFRHLVHVRLFGGPYVGAVERIAARLGC
jgi:hypothetical protein